jgi:hypothetical protein
MEKAVIFDAARQISLTQGRFDELEFAFCLMAIECVFDHPTLFRAADVEELVLATMLSYFGRTAFDYQTGDARAYLDERALSGDARDIVGCPKK